MKHWFLIFGMLFFIGCNNDHVIKIGVYRKCRMNLFETGIRNIFQNVTGSHCSTKLLIIKKDSTFAYDISSEIITGNWRCSNDSLYLYGKNIIIKKEELKQFITKEGTHNFLEKPRVFKICNNNLIRFIRTIDNKIIIEKLKYNLP